MPRALSGRANRFPLKLTSFRELSRARPCVDPRLLPRYVRPFTDNDPILWIEASSLRGNDSRYVPFDMVHLNLTWPLPSGSGCFPIGSNGLASGNTLSEAIVHGLWELVERDALALFYQMPAELQWLRRVRLETVDDVAAREMLER